jgi:hypothetical protein
VNTEKTHQRFWEAMRARFGLRWFTEFGDKPTAPWIQLLNGFTPETVRKALELMAEQKLAHPPTLPVFEAILRKAANKHDSEHAQDYVRGFWRSVVVQECSDLLTHREAIANAEAFEDYLRQHRVVLGEPLRLLLDELCDMEQRNEGQRTPGIHTHAQNRCRAIVGERLRLQLVPA